MMAKRHFISLVVSKRGAHVESQKRPNKKPLNAVNESVKYVAVVFLCAIAAAPLTRAQNSSPGNTPSLSGGAKPAHVVRKQPANPRQMQVPNSAALKQPPTGQVAPTNSAPRRPANVISYSEALGRCVHARHTRFWWRNHFTTIVLVGGGYYYWDAGYWFPAWGYDPNYEAYDYDGPIFTYGNLLPDQVIVNVQRALQQLGYFAGPISGSLSPATRRAISAFQQDEGLEINGIVDGSTVYALGLI
jgi:hypothetical protein